MATDAQIVANIRMMMDHFDKVDNRFELSNVMGEVPLLVEWLEKLLDGEPYDWREFTVDVLTAQHHDGSFFSNELKAYKEEVGYEH